MANEGESLSRRDALRLGAAAFCAAATPGRAASGAVRVPIGVQLYSVRHECEKDLSGTLHAIAGMGYAAVEFAGYYGRGAAELRKLLDAGGLRCCGTHTGLETLEGDALAATIEFNRVIGNRFLIVPWIPDERRRTAEDWKALAALFDAISDTLAPHGMRVGYHNHNFEFAPLAGTTAWDIFFGGTKQVVVMQVDTGNCVEGGADPVALLQQYPGRAATVHVKEFSRAKPAAFVGEGELPWKRIFEACEAGGTEWYIVEYEHENQPPLPAIARCLKNLHAMGK